MKIIYFNHTSFIGGAGWCLYQLVKALPKGFAEPIVVLPAEGGLSHAFRALGIRVIIAPAIQPLMDNSSSSTAWRWANVRFFVARNRGTKACQQICEEEVPDMVHLNSSVLFHLAEGAKRAGVKKVLLHVREHWAVKPWDPREWLKRRKVPAFADDLIAISKTSARLFGYEQNTTVVYDWPEFQGRDTPVDLEKEYGISPRKKIILVPGGRPEIKGSLVALRAMEMVHDPDALMLVPGGGGTGGKGKAFVRKMLKIFHIQTYGLRLDQAVERLGDRARVIPSTLNMKSLMEASVVVVSPFTTPHLSMPSMEAGLLKKPVVISDNGHAHETVLAGQSGLIVPPGDMYALAEALNRLLSNEPECQKMGEAGYGYVTGRFQKESSMQKLLNAYSGIERDSHVS